MNSRSINQLLISIELVAIVGSVILAIIWLFEPSTNVEPIIVFLGLVLAVMEIIRRRLGKESDSLNRRVDAQLAAIKEIKREEVPLKNKISQAAFPLQQGHPEAGRDAEQILQRWVTEYDGVLPDDVMSPLYQLQRRVVDWRVNMGSNDTPGAMIEGDNAPLRETSKGCTRA